MPHFTVPYVVEDATRLRLAMALGFWRLTADQLQQFNLLRKHESAQFPDNVTALCNSFTLDAVDGEHQNRGIFPLQSRFHHSCVPNSRVSPSGEQQRSLSRIATRDISQGEEITFCYLPLLEYNTRRERQLALVELVCKCEACLPGTPFQEASDMRRRLLHGLHYFLTGRDIDGKKLSDDSSPIIFPELKRAAENREITRP